MRRERWLVVALLLSVATLARWCTFANPVIGFDEQFYLLVGDRLWQGLVPFVDVFDRKPFGLFVIYAAARGLGGDGFLQYKLVALAFVVSTAFLIYRIGRQRAGVVAAVSAGSIYLVWLDFMEGEGGQAPVFYALPMVIAGTILLEGARSSHDPRRAGAGAMLLVGIALQIKYSVVVEGIYFGCWLIAAARRSGARGTDLVTSIALWIGCALLPTALVFLCYAIAGQAHAFAFANFLSVFAQGRGNPKSQLAGAAVIVAVLAPLAAFLLVNRRQVLDPGDAFLWGWVAAAVVGVVAYWRFVSPQYALPVLLPLSCLLATSFDAGRARRMGGVLLVVAGLIGGQVVLMISERQKGGAHEAMAVASAAHIKDGRCIYVYDGYPALYMLTHSCVPSRWAFPGHLNTSEEASAAALGIDPSEEVRRILATRPVAIIDDFPRFAGGNRATHRLLRDALDRHYAIAACIHTGPDRVRLVYRLRSEHPARPSGCPVEAIRRQADRNTSS